MTSPEGGATWHVDGQRMDGEAVLQGVCNAFADHLQTTCRPLADRVRAVCRRAPGIDMFTQTAGRRTCGVACSEMPS